MSVKETTDDNVSYLPFILVLEGRALEIVEYVPKVEIAQIHVAAVREAVTDALSPRPEFVHRTVAASIARASSKTAHLRLERLARVVMAADSRMVDPREVWAADWSQVNVATLEVMDAAIRDRWQAPTTRNAMRDSVRSVVRQSLNLGLLTHDQATPLLHVLRPEKPKRDEEKQARGHIPARRVQEIFHQLALDPALMARRDTAMIALMVGSGLRRGEIISMQVEDLKDGCERAVITGKGDMVRDVPLAAGVRRALLAWLKIRGEQDGYLFNPISKTVPRTVIAERPISENTLVRTVEQRCGKDIRPHDLRRTFTGDFLESGADLSIAAKVLGHASPATTAGYDRRGFTARRAAMDRFSVPFEEPQAVP